MVETITFRDGEVVLLVDFDLPRERARDLIDAGRAAVGPELEAPAALYLLHPLEMPDGHVYPAGHMLHVGGELTEAQAIGLIRNEIGVHALMRGIEQPQTPAVSLPGGGIG